MTFWANAEMMCLPLKMLYTGGSQTFSVYGTLSVPEFSNAILSDPEFSHGSISVPSFHGNLGVPEFSYDNLNVQSFHTAPLVYQVFTRHILGTTHLNLTRTLQQIAPSPYTLSIAWLFGPLVLGTRTSIIIRPLWKLMVKVQGFNSLSKVEVYFGVVALYTRTTITHAALHHTLCTHCIVTLSLSE